MAQTTFEENWEHLKISIQPVENENPDAYQAFLAYAYLQYDDRTIKKTVEVTGYPETHVKRWLSEFDWIERAKSLDATRWVIEYEARQALLKEDNQSFIESNRKQKKEFLSAGEKMLDFVNKGLDLLQRTDETETVESEYVETIDGRVVPTIIHTTIKVAWKASDLPRYAEAALKLQRGVNDLPTEVIETPQSSESVKELTTDEIKARRDEIQREINSIIQANGVQ